MKNIFILFALILFMYSCKHDPLIEPIPPAENICDSTAVSYAEDIVTIIDEHCISCHQGSTAEANVWLDNYNDVKIVVDSGSFYGSIAHDSLFVAMPYGLAKLDDCKIATVKNWISEGALNN